MIWTTWRKPLASACFLLLPVPTFAQVTRPSSRRTPISRTSLQGISTSTSAQKKRGAPDCFFCWILPGFRFWQAGEWQRIKGASTSLRQNTSEPNPRLRDQPFDFHVTASLLGTIATAFCRGGQLERPGDVICGGNRRIRAVHASSSWAHPFARSLSVSHVKVCMMQVFGVVSLASLGRSRCTGDAGTGPTGRRCTA